jgi:type III secretory pathway component EscT
MDLFFLGEILLSILLGFGFASLFWTCPLRGCSHHAYRRIRAG